MTETFLDREEVKVLLADLRVIITHHAELLRVARRETSPPGGKASRNPNGYSSRPPVNLSALSVSHDLGAVLAGWACNLRDDAGVSLPERRDSVALAVHLQRCVHRVAQQVWAPDAAEEIHMWSRRMLRFTSPPAEPKYIGPCQAEGRPQCRGLFTGDGRDGFCSQCQVEYDVHAVRAATEARIEEGKSWQTFTAAEICRLVRDTYGFPVRRHHIDGMLRRKVNPLRERGKNLQGQALFTIRDVVDRLPERVKVKAS